MAKEQSANYTRQNKLFWGTFVKAIGKDNCYEVVFSVTRSHKWSEITEAQRELVLKELGKKHNIDVARRAETKRTEPAPPSNVIAFPKATKPVSAQKNADVVSDYQISTIEKLQKNLKWSTEQLHGFTNKRWQKDYYDLTSQLGHKLIFLLLHIAASKMCQEHPELKELSESEVIEGIKEDLGIRGYASRKTS